jgi:hypothetical protein
MTKYEMYHILLPYTFHCTNFSVCTEQPSGTSLAIMVQTADMLEIPFFKNKKPGFLVTFRWCGGGIEDNIFNLSHVNYFLYLTNMIFSIKVFTFFFTKGQSKPLV